MAWEGPETGVRVQLTDGSERTPRCSPMQLTSVSIAWVDSSVAAPVLRMYGVDERVIDAALAYEETTGDPYLCDAVDAADYAPLVRHARCNLRHVLRSENRDDEFIQYMDAPSGVEDFWVLPSADRAEATLQSTCIPQGRHFPTFSHRQLDYSTRTAALYASDTVISKYGGVCVLQIPGDKWLMLLHRRYAPLDDPTEQPSLGTANGYLEIHCVNSDIVAYVSDGPGFTEAENTVGPFWMVDALDALPATEMPQSISPKPRMYLGVPGAVVDGTYLYIYYAVTPNYYFDDQRGDRSGVGCPSTAGGDAAAGYGAYNYAFVTEAPYYGQAFRPCIACKRIDLADFATWRQRMLTDETTWEFAEMFGLEACCPGEGLGRVRVWTADSPGIVRPLELRLPDDGKLIDPEPVLCDDGSLSLIFPATGCHPNLPVVTPPDLMGFGQGCGLWRAGGYEDDQVLLDLDAPGFVWTTRGKDFLVRYASYGRASGSPDMIVEFGGDPTATGGVQFLNAAVVRMSARLYRVYTGGSKHGLFSEGYSTFSYFSGNLRDMCGV